VDTGYTGETKSYPTQSDESYCAECLVAHYAVALAMVEEAKRLSMGLRELNRESLARISEALKELSGSLYDLGKVSAEWADWFRAKAREVRKQVLTPLLAAPWRLDLLDQAMRELKEMYERAVEVLQETYREEQAVEEAEVAALLEEFSRLGDPKLLLRAGEKLEKSRCEVCRSYVARALEAVERGDMEEARSLASILAHGIRMYLGRLSNAGKG